MRDKGMKNKPRNINEWNLDKKSYNTVKRELGKWLNLFIHQADGREGNVYRADFVNDDFFFFTECHDLMQKDVESKARENNKSIRKRKDKVKLQLLVKTILGEKIGKKISCTHCGYDDVTVEGLTNGHVYFCPKCGKTDISAYPDDFELTISDVRRMLWRWEIDYDS